MLKDLGDDVPSALWHVSITPYGCIEVKNSSSLSIQDRTQCGSWTIQLENASPSSKSALAIAKFVFQKNADSSPKIGWPHKKDVDPFCTFARWSGGDPVHLSTTGEMRKARAASLHGDKRLDHPANSSEAALAKKRCSRASENANFAIWSLANCSTNAFIVL